ncbi:hypothetical protein AgCh_038256 [Apium graveolens]
MPLLLFVALVGATAGGFVNMYVLSTSCLVISCSNHSKHLHLPYGGTIEAPHPLLSFDYEVELAIVIGLNAHDVCEPTIVLENLEETREEVFLAGTIEIQGKYYLRIDPLGEGAKWRRTYGQEIYSPFLLAFTEQDGDTDLL